MYRVLVVDDEVPFVESIRNFDWNAYGCHLVGVAYDGKEALEKCASLLPHIVITDIHMPVADGLTLMRMLRETYPEIQVVVLSAHQSFSYAQHALRLQAVDYLVKDMHLRDALPSALEKTINTFRMHPEAQNDRHTRLLNHSGRLLVLQSEKVLTEMEDVLTDFLSRYQGTLAGICLLQPFADTDKLVARLDMLLHRQDVGIIVFSPGWFELLLSCPWTEAQGLLLNLLPGMVIDVDTSAPFAVYAKNVVSYQAYLAAHALCSQSLHVGFYQAAPMLAPASAQDFVHLPDEAIDGWLRTLETLGADREALCAFIQNALFAACMNARYHPTQVRAAFDRLLRRLETRYATQANEKAHAALRYAPTLQGLCTALSDAVQALLSEATGYSFPVQKAIDCMLQRLGDMSLQLADVAQQAFISPGYLSKRLKEETGQSFQELLIRMRMERAGQLLRKGDKKVYEVASAVGYQSQRSFSAAFLAHYGVNPKKYT